MTPTSHGTVLRNSSAECQTFGIKIWKSNCLNKFKGMFTHLCTTEHRNEADFVRAAHKVFLDSMMCLQQQRHSSMLHGGNDI